jgi:SAM-dependent methyltransferase
MTSDLYQELYLDLPAEGPERLIYTRKAFRMLPKIDAPRILDIGCGRGSPTLELARLSKGHVTGIDVNHSSLDDLNRRIKEQGLDEMVSVFRCSMLEMDFDDESFDVVWSEASIWVTGFEKGLRGWRRLIKPEGFLVVHEMVWLRTDPPKEIQDYWKETYPAINIRTVDDMLKMIPGCGYKVMGHFKLPEDAWWDLYYGPLEDRVKELNKKYSGDTSARGVLEKEQREIDLYKKYPEYYGSAFFIMQKA